MTMTVARAAGTDVPSYTETWPCEEASAPKARQLVSVALSLWGIGASEGAEDILLIASELVANAITHSGRRSFRIRVSRIDRATVKVVVGDTNRAVPTLQGENFDSENGRGLRLVDALSTNWGYDRKPWGKVVWAEFQVPNESAATQES